MTRRCETLNNEVKTGFIEINTKDAEARGIINGEVVKAFSRRGEIAIPARVTDDIKEGIVNIPMHFVDGAANVVTNSDSFDPKSKMVELKACAIQVEKLPEVVEMKGEVYKEGTDTEIKAENMATTTVKVGK
jgi:formate dehydrogenase major subunit